MAGKTKSPVRKTIKVGRFELATPISPDHVTVKAVKHQYDHVARPASLPIRHRLWELVMLRASGFHGYEVKGCFGTGFSDYHPEPRSQAARAGRE